MHHPTDRIAHTTAFVRYLGNTDPGFVTDGDDVDIEVKCMNSVGVNRFFSYGTLAGTRNSSMGPAHEGSIRRPITP